MHPASASTTTSAATTGTKRVMCHVSSCSARRRSSSAGVGGPPRRSRQPIPSPTITASRYCQRHAFPASPLAMTQPPGRRRRLSQSWSERTSPRCPHQEINNLIGGAAEVRSLFMTTEFDVPSPASAQVDVDTSVQVCDACGHARLSHDAIATRYCRASRDHALDRECICAVRASNGETEKGNSGSAARRSKAPMYGRGRFSGR